MAEKGQIELPIIADLEPLMQALDKAIAKVSKTTEDVGKKTDNLTKKMEKQGKSIQNGIEKPLKNINATTKNVFSKMTQLVKNAGSAIGNDIKSGIDKAILSVKNGAEKMKASLKSIGTTCSDIGGKISGIGSRLSLMATTPIVLFGKKAFEDASDYEENLNKLSVVFGDLQADMNKFSNEALKNFGMSKNTASEMLSLFGDMGKSMGVPLDAVAEMSTSLTGLAGDLASFKNIELDQAMTALKGVFTGEGESLKNLGVVMNDTTLSAFALEKGMKKQYSKMSQAEKVALRYQYVMEMTKDAQGDFARTSDGASNQTRSFGEAMENLRITIGQKLLPIFTPFIMKINDMLVKFSEMSPEMQDFVVKFGMIVAAIGPGLLIIGKLVSSFGAIASVLTGLSLPIVGVIAGIGTLFFAFKENTGGIRDVIFDCMDKIKGAFSDNLPEIQAIFENTMELLSDVWTDVGEPLFSTLGEILSNVVDIFIQYFPQMLEVFNFVIQGISDVWSSIGKPVFDIFISLVRGVWDIVIAVLPSVMNIFTTVFGHIKAIWDTVLAPVLGKLGDIFTNHIKPAVDLVLPPLIEIFKTLGEIVSDVFLNYIQPKIQGFMDLMGTLGEYATPVIDAIMWAFDGLAAAIGWAFDKLNDFLNLFRKNKGEIQEAGSVGASTVSITSQLENFDAIPSVLSKVKVGERMGSVLNTLTNGYSFAKDFNFIESSSSKNTQKVSVNDMKKTSSQNTTIKTAIYLDKRQIVEAIASGVDTKNNQYVELESRRVGGRVTW